MKEIEFSVMFHNQRAIDLLKKLLGDFEKQQNIKVNLTVLNWNDAWTELVKVALYQDGPDISEIGNTWVSDFARMNALNPFTESEIKILGGSEKFLPSLWESSHVYGNPEIWAIPWLADTRILYYRRDMLHSAGIDEEGAFDSFEAFTKTLEKLLDNGINIPVAIPTLQTRMTLHHIASWVWGSNGNFLSPDGKKSLIDTPEALEGLTRYFSLIKYLGPQARAKNDTESDGLYWSGDAAATLSGTWMMVEESISDQVRANTSFISPPGIPYLGGSHLAIWKHSWSKPESLKFIQFLNSPEVQIAYTKEIGLLPVMSDVLTLPSFSDNIQYKKLIDRLKLGRSFRSVPLWGMVENRLSGILNVIWDDLLQEPDADVRKVIEERILSFNQRLNMTLQQS